MDNLKEKIIENIDAYDEGLVKPIWLVDQVLVLIRQEIKECLPEEGIKSMQEGSNKDRRGYSDGFNECRQNIITNLKAKNLWEE